MIKKLIAIAILLLWPMSAKALMPPKKIEEMNLGAEVIIIGRVSETGRILLPLDGNDEKKPKGIFVMEVYHVIKGFDRIMDAEPVRVIFRLPPEVPIGLETVIAGNPPVSVEKGDVILAYLRATPNTDFFQAVLAGSSILDVNKPAHVKAPEGYDAKDSASEHQ